VDAWLESVDRTTEEKRVDGDDIGDVRGGHFFTINRNFGFSVVPFGFGFVSQKFVFRYRNRFSSYTEPKYQKTEYKTLRVLKFDYLIM
jgi:hypothetical protein